MHQYSAIPITSVKDTIMNPSELCSGVRSMVSKYNKEHEKERKAKEPEFKPIYEKLAKLFNIDINTIYMGLALRLRDVLISRVWDGYPLGSENISMELINETEAIDKYYSYNYYFRVQYEDRIVYKIISSDFLNKVKELISLKIDSIEHNKSMPLKFALFLGHDTMLNAILMSLGINDGNILVPFAAAIIIELYKDKDNSYFVDIIFDEKEHVKYELNKFYELIKRNTYDPETNHQYCKEFKETHKESNKIPVFAWISGIICICASLIAIVISIIGCLKTNKITEEDYEN